MNAGTADAAPMTVPDRVQSGSTGPCSHAATGKIKKPVKSVKYKEGLQWQTGMIT